MNIKGFLFRSIGIYSIFMGAFFVIGSIYHYVVDFMEQEQGAIIVIEPLHLEQIVVLLFSIGSVSWLIIGGLLSFKKDSEFRAITLLLTQMIIEFLTGFTIGMYFVPVTVILVVSVIGYNLIKS
jgi:hypothetical protein